MTLMLLDGHQSATALRPVQVSTRSVAQAQSAATMSADISSETSSRAPSSPRMMVQPALSFQASFQTMTLVSDKAKDGTLNHPQAAASIGISLGLLNCYVAIFRSLGGQMPVQHRAAGFERRYEPELVAGFASVRQQVREGADIRSAMAALQLRQQDAKPSKKPKGRAKLEHLLELNAHLSQQVSVLRSELSAIKQQTDQLQDEDTNQDIRA